MPCFSSADLLENNIVAVKFRNKNSFANLISQPEIESSF